MRDGKMEGTVWPDQSYGSAGVLRATKARVVGTANPDSCNKVALMVAGHQIALMSMASREFSYHVVATNQDIIGV